MKPILFLLAAAMALTACTTTSRFGHVAQVGIGLYCAGVTDAGKQAIRDAVTGGQPLIACPPGTHEVPVGSSLSADDAASGPR